MVKLSPLSLLIKFLLILFFAGGIFFTFLIPPFQKPDEVVHFKKAIAVATGQLFCSENVNHSKSVVLPTYLSELSAVPYTDIVAFYPEAKIPKQVYKNLLTQKYDPNLTSSDATTCTLPFIYYIPSAIAISPLLALKAHPLIIFYAGRLAIFLTTFVVFIFALRFMPRKYYFLLLFMFCLPTTLLLITSYSKDALHIGLGLLTFSILLASREQPKSVKKGDIILFYLSLLLTIWARIQYAPLLFLGLLMPLPNDLNVFRLPSIIKKIAVLLIVIVIFFGGLLLMMQKGGYVGDQADSTKILVQSYIYPSVQIQIVKDNPLIPLQIIIRSVNENSGEYMNSMIAITGWFETYDISFVYLAYYGFFIYLVVLSTRSFTRLDLKETILLCFIVFTTILSIFVAMWVYGTPVGSSVVENINGRYFILLIPLSVWGVSNIYHLLNKRLPYMIAGATALLILVSIYNRYYNTARFYDKNIDRVYRVESSYKERSISDGETFYINVDPARKLLGIRVLVTNVLPIKPYKISLLDQTCSVEIVSSIPNMAQMKSDSFNDILFDTATSSKSQLCVRFRILSESKIAENMKIMTIKNDDKMEIYPLYLY